MLLYYAIGHGKQFIVARRRSQYAVEMATIDVSDKYLSEGIT